MRGVLCKQTPRKEICYISKFPDNFPPRKSIKSAHPYKLNQSGYILLRVKWRIVAAFGNTGNMEHSGTSSKKEIKKILFLKARK